MVRTLCSLLIFFVFASCGSEDPFDDTTQLSFEQQKQATLQTFYHNSNEVVLEVGYEPNARPHDGQTVQGTPYWQIAEDNIVALLENRERSINFEIPKSVNQMREIAPQQRDSWSASEIMELARSQRQYQSNDRRAAFYLVFLNGHFRLSNGEVNPNIIGVNISGTTVMAIFKDVVERVSNSSREASMIEQATVVHEFGHAAGLVNLGVAPQSNHEDPGHNGHCSNSSCVMYWRNESANQMRQFVRDLVLGGKTILFDQQCLESAHSY